MDHPPCASPTHPWSPWHQNDAKNNKVKKTYFPAPRQTKNFQYLGTRESDAEIPLLHFVITRHFRAACKFSSKNYGPLSRTWIFSALSYNGCFFFLGRRKGTLPYVATVSWSAQQHDHLGVTTASIFILPRLCSHNDSLKQLVCNKDHSPYLQWNSATKCDKFMCNYFLWLILYILFRIY